MILQNMIGCLHRVLAHQAEKTDLQRLGVSRERPLVMLPTDRFGQKPTFNSQFRFRSSGYTSWLMPIFEGHGFPHAHAGALVAVAESC